MQDMEMRCFKAYDIRGKLGTELNEEIAMRIGRAFGIWLTDKNHATHSATSLTVALGSDIRPTSTPLKQALAKGLHATGINTIDLGMTGTEEVYFATFHRGVAGGIEVTASHNPLDYNGMKFVQAGSRPISGDSGLHDIRDMAADDELMASPAATKQGTMQQQSSRAAYIDHLLNYITPANLQPMKLVVNAGNGAAGPTLDAIEQQLHLLNCPIEFIKIHHQPDGSFPHGIPNPLLPENRSATRDAVLEHKADMGIAWDGDFDRCFLFDETGRFIEGYYIVGLLAAAFLQKQTGEKIIHDPRLTWNTIEVAEQNQGIPIQSKTGHAFIKERMRQEDAVYGGEMSAHHYFRDFAYCDSGMIPWLLIAELMSTQRKPLSALVDARMQAFPCSGEINFRVNSPRQAMEQIRTYFTEKASDVEIDTTDGLSMAFGDWRFNLRSSNTEPVIRLNVESRNNAQLMAEQTELLSGLIEKYGA